MAGRTSDIQTSSFKPLDLNEIMMVPLAKQKMEDEILMGADKFGSLTSDVLGSDSKTAKSTIGGFKERASALSDDVIERGVSRSQFNKLRGLKNETNAEMTTGFVGKAMANKKAAAAYMQAMATKKERQAGWSPKQAQQWAASQVGGFGGTQNEDGSFNSFSGQELSAKVDEAEYIRKAIDDVAERVSDTSMRLIKIGGLPAFTRAFEQGTVKAKDFNEIMKSISRQAQSDPDLVGHLQQQAFFTGEKNPLDHGSFENVTRKDSEGVEYTEKIWKVGQSRFGRRMAGMGDASDYRNIESNITLSQDKVGFKMWELGMDEKQATTMVNFTNGKLTDVKRATLSQLRKNLVTSGETVTEMLSEKTRYEKDLLNNNPEYTALEEQIKKRLVSPEEDKKGQEALDVMKTKILSGNKLWKEMNKNYTDSSIKQSNAKAAVDTVYSIANKSLTSDQKEGLALTKEIEENVPGYTPGDTKRNIGLLELALQRIGSPVNKEQGVAELSYYDMDQDNKEAFLLSSYLEATGHEVEKNARADRSLFMPSGSSGRSYDKDIVGKMTSANKALNNKVESILEASPRAESFTTITGQDLGKLKSPKVSQLNTLKLNNFNRGDMTLAYGGGIFTDEDAADLIGDSTKGYSYVPSFTDSWDDTGNKFDNVVLTNLETSEVTTIQVVNNNDKDNELMAAHQIYDNGTPAQKAMAKRVIAGYEYMPSVKASRMYDQNEGQVFVPIQDKNGKAVKVKWVRNTEYSTPFYTASINGIPLNNGQAIKGENGMVNVIYDYVNSKMKKEDGKQ